VRFQRGGGAWSAFVGGGLLGGLVVCLAWNAVETRQDRDGQEPIEAAFGSGLAQSLMATFGSQLSQDLGAGDYVFLPNRRTIWVANRTTGRFANYDFRDLNYRDSARLKSRHERMISRSNVVTLDQEDFSAADTVYVLSDRNLTTVLWVCNRRTGDVQLWQRRADDKVTQQGQVVTSIDLMMR